LLLEVPQLLRGILEHATQRQSGCQLLNGLKRDFELGAERTEAPDVVILGLTAAEDSALVPAVFARWPSAQVMTVMQTGGEATVYELRPRRRVMDQVSPDEMLAALCAAVHRSRELPRT
jgi:hypothetical protein